MTVDPAAAPVHGGANAAEHAGGPALPQLDWSLWPSSIFWLLLAFGVLYWMLSNLLPRIGAGIKARNAKIDGDLDLARAANDKAIAAKTELEAAVKSAHAQATSLIDANRARFRATFDAESASAQAALEAKTAEAETRVRAVKEKALAEIDEAVRDVAPEIVRVASGLSVSSQDFTRS